MMTLIIGLMLGVLLSQSIIVYRALKQISRLQERVGLLELKLDELWKIIDKWTVTTVRNPE